MWYAWTWLGASHPSVLCNISLRQLLQLGGGDVTIDPVGGVLDPIVFPIRTVIPRVIETLIKVINK
jgi:hypothetical protein